MKISDMRPGELFRLPRSRSVWMVTDGWADKPGRVMAVRVQPAAGGTMSFDPFAMVEACGPDVRRVLGRADVEMGSRADEFRGCRFVDTGRPVA